MTDRTVIACNYVMSTSVVALGAKAYVLAPNFGNASDRIEILARSRGGRWVRKWESARRLGDFRLKTVPPEHPRYAALEYAFGDPETLAWLRRNTGVR